MYLFCSLCLSQKSELDTGKFIFMFDLHPYNCSALLKQSFINPTDENSNPQL